MLMAFVSGLWLQIDPVELMQPGVCLQSIASSLATKAADALGDKYIAPKGYVCYRAETITIDGILNEPDWARSSWTDDFVDIEGDIKPIPRFRTRAKMLWDDSYFYIAADIEEPHVWATLTKHDSIIFHDNDFEVFIDPDGDHHYYAEF